MSLDERLFGWLYRALARRRTRPEAASEHAVFLEDVADRLSLVASALGGRAFAVRRAERVGGVQRATLLLPVVIDAYPSAVLNMAAYHYRVAFSVRSELLGFSMAGLQATPASRAQATLLAVAATRFALERDLPQMADLLVALRPESRESYTLPATASAIDTLAYGDPLDEDPVEGVAALHATPPSNQSELVAALGGWGPALARDLPDLAPAFARHALLFGELLLPIDKAPPTLIGDPSQDAREHAGGTERKAPARDEVDVLTLRSKEDENPVVHSFEKVHTLDDYSGGQKRMDGEDHLEEQLEALEDLDLRGVIRTGQTASSVYRADGLFDGGLAGGEDDEETRRGVSYDEWDGKRRRYLRDWCTLYPSSPPCGARPEVVSERMGRVRREYAAEIKRLRAAFEAIEASRAWRSRQREGDALDMDQVVMRSVDMVQGGRVEERVYMHRRRHARDLATLVLLDVSLSSDSYVDDHRILDVSRDSLLVLGEVLGPASDEFGVAGFYSHTRRDCRWLPLKTFAEPWTMGAARLIALQPRGYTRIGAALRHGIAELGELPAKRRLLLLVSDGRPTDYDRYEGRHGIEDVRQAFREAEAQGISPFALTIASKPDASFVRLFGAGRFRTLPTPAALPSSLAEVYAQLAMGA